MSFCSQCGQKALANAHFCAKCGANLSRPSQSTRAQLSTEALPPQRSSPSRSQRAGETRGHAEGIEAYKAMTNIRKQKRRKGFWLVTLAMFLALVAGFAFLKDFGTIGAIVSAACVVTIGIAIWVTPSQRLAQAEYAALPGAVVAPHGHQCIFCGGRGIYRHTPYKTNTTLADCSKCKNELWYE